LAKTTGVDCVASFCRKVYEMVLLRIEDCSLIWFVSILFGLTAVIYGSSGFGGGSTYISLLTAVGTDFATLPVVALVCNIVVVARTGVSYLRYGLVPKSAWSLIGLSLPFAFIGGLLSVDEDVFVALLACSLVASSIAMIRTKTNEVLRPSARSSSWRRSAVGAVSGLLAGMVGIGGGVFLAPLLHAERCWTPKMIAATTSLFILCNSVVGLIARFASGQAAPPSSLLPFAPLVVAVLVGGHIGSRLGTKLFSEERVRQVAALVVFVVGVRLIFQFLQRTIVG